MKSTEKRRKICDSVYNQAWFRIVLVIVGIDMIVLGFSFAIGLDILTMAPELGLVLRIIFGLMYIVVALFIIHYSLAYAKIKKKSYFLCHHCGHTIRENEKKETKSSF